MVGLFPDRRFAVASLLLAATRCGIPSPPPGEKEPQPPPVSAQFVFEADQDPAIAALAFIPTELLVQPYPGADRNTLERLYTDVGATPVDELAEIDTSVLQIPEGRLPEVAGELLRSGLIENAQKNYLFSPEAAPNDPLYPRQDHFAQVNAAAAWDVTTGSSSVIIAIVDTGVNAAHPDLAGRLLDGWNMYDGNSSYGDVAGHGTQVAGVAGAASNNGVGVASLAWNCPLLPVRVGDSQGFSTGRHIAAGILWAAGHGARVINVSFAPLWSDRVVRSAAQTAFNRGCAVVISAGNAGGTTTAGGYDEALFVGAVDSNDDIAAFSDRGPFVDLVAPGTGIRTTTRDGDYGMANGTSFAAPVVSGVAALAWASAPGLRPATLQKLLLDTAGDLGATGKDDVYGAGVVNAFAAVSAARQAELSPDSSGPLLRILRPTSGEQLSGRYTVSIEAGDSGGLADVSLSIDGVPFATDTRSPYQFVVDASTFSVGAHVLAATATDAYGNSTTPRTVAVTFAATSTAVASASAGRIVFRSPAAGSTVSGDVTISASVSDADGLAVVEWLIDGKSALVSTLTGTSSGISLSWRARGSTPGRHTITLILTDTTGARTTGTLSLTRG